MCDLGFYIKLLDCEDIQAAAVVFGSAEYFLCGSQPRKTENYFCEGRYGAVIGTDLVRKQQTKRKFQTDADLWHVRF